jgi:hypothetical protein
MHLLNKQQSKKVRKAPKKIPVLGTLVEYKTQVGQMVQ